MRVYLAMTGVDHQPLHIRFVNKLLKQSLPYTPITPAAEPPVGVLPVAVAGREIAPWRASSQNPEDGVKKTAVVLGDAAPLPALPGKMWLKELPGGIGEVVSSRAFGHGLYRDAGSAKVYLIS